MLTLGFPDGSSGKESACSEGETGNTSFNPWVRRIFWRGPKVMAAICNSEFLMPVESRRQRKKLPCYHDEIGLLLYHGGTREACLDLSGIYWCCHAR